MPVQKKSGNLLKAPRKFISSYYLAFYIVNLISLNHLVVVFQIPWSLFSCNIDLERVAIKLKIWNWKNDPWINLYGYIMQLL